MPYRNEDPPGQEPRRNDCSNTLVRNDNHHRQLVATKDHFLSLLPSFVITYQLTIVCRRDSAWNKSEVKSVIDAVYKRICERFVHKRRYAKEPYRQFMPYLLAIVETDGKVMSHVHAMLAVHPSLTEKFDSLAGYDTFVQFDERVKSSHLSRTITDTLDVENFDEPTNVEKWLNYMMKQKNVQPKTPEDLRIFGPRQ